MKKHLLLLGMLFLAGLGFAQTLPKCDKSPNPDLAPVMHLSADYLNDIVLLTWDFPETYQPVTEQLSWSGPMYQQEGSYLQSGMYEDLAHKFDTLDLRNFIGWRVKSIGIIPVDSLVIYHAAVWVKEGEDYQNIYQEPLTDTVLFEENVHQLNRDIFIEAGKEYLFGCRDLCDPSLQGLSGFYNAIDSGPANDKNMHYNFYLGWQPWHSMWNICLNTIIESPTGETMILGQKEDALTGYRVYKNGNLVKSIDRCFQTYHLDGSYMMGETATYSVTAMYGEMESEPVSVTITYDGIENHEGINLTLSPNPTNDLVCIEGASVAEVKVFNALGQLVKTVQGTNEISVVGLPEGVYVLRIRDEKGNSFMERVSVGR